MRHTHLLHVIHTGRLHVINKSSVRHTQIFCTPYTQIFCTFDTHLLHVIHRFLHVVHTDLLHVIHKSSAGHTQICTLCIPAHHTQIVCTSYTNIHRSARYAQIFYPSYTDRMHVIHKSGHRVQVTLYTQTCTSHTDLLYVKHRYFTRHTHRLYVRYTHIFCTINTQIF